MGATRRSPPSWRRGRSGDGARTTRSWRPASTGRCRRSSPRSSTRCGSAPTSWCRCGCPTTPRSAPPSTWSGPGSNTGAGNFVNAVLRSVSERDFDEWIDKITPDERSSPTRYAALAFSHPEWVVDELREAVGQDELHALLAADNENPRVTLVARPGRSTRDELPGEPTPYSPYGVVLGGWRPTVRAGGRRGARRRPGRGVAAGRPGAGRGTARGPRRALAGPVRRTRRQGRAARGAGLRAGREAGRQRAAAGARRAGTPHARHRRRLRPGRGRRGRCRRDAGAVPCRHLRPGARRRALHRAGRAAPPPRGAVAAQARRPARAGDAAAPAGPRRARPGPARRRGPLRDLLTGGLGDLERRHLGARRPHRRRARGPRPAVHRRASLGGAGPRHHPAVAAPARHRRDVHGAVPPHLSGRR